MILGANVVMLQDAFGPEIVDEGLTSRLECRSRIRGAVPYLRRQ